MGLTRYWYRPPSMDAESFRDWASDCRRILETATMPAGFRPEADETHAPNPPVTLRGPDGTGEPLISDRVVALNGDATCGHEHEAFQVERDVASGRRRQDELGRIFEYCKTAGKPYDAVVHACLMALEQRFGALVKVEADHAAAQLTGGKRLFEAALRLR